MRGIRSKSVLAQIAILSIALLSSIAQAETTRTQQIFNQVFEDENVAPQEATARCEIRVRGNYNMRNGPSTQYSRCGAGTLDPALNRKVEVLAIVGNWIKYKSGCEKGFAFSHENAFQQTDINSIKTNKCPGVQIIEPRATVSTSNSTAVRTLPRNKARMRFPLDRCMGIKHIGGNGLFGRTRNGGRKFHNGCDYYSPKGTPIKSPCNGRVTQSMAHNRGSRSGRNAGNRVYITCDNGYKFRMFHLHSKPPRIRSGARVRSGTIIGGVGNSGNAQEQNPHLHLELFKPNGARDNPTAYWDCDHDSGK